METMIARTEKRQWMGAFLNPEAVDVTLSAEEAREKNRLQREGTPQIRGLGIIPYLEPPKAKAAAIGFGALSIALSAAGAVASVRAVQGEKQVIWKILFGVVGLALAGNTIRSAIETGKVL